MLPASLLLACTLALLSPSLASNPAVLPTSFATSSVLAVSNRADAGSYQNVDGGVNQDYLRKEMRYVAGKYSRESVLRNGRRNRRAHEKKEDGKGHAKNGEVVVVEGQTGEAALTNEAIIEYDATVSMGTPSQSIIFNMDTGTSLRWIDDLIGSSLTI